MKIKLATLVLLISTGLAFAADKPSPQRLDYTSYEQILKQYVDASGRVNYSKLKQQGSAKLKATIEQFYKVSKDRFDRWSEKAQIAYLINAYNLYTLKVIVDHYPIKKSFLISIRQASDTSVAHGRISILKLVARKSHLMISNTRYCVRSIRSPGFIWLSTAPLRVVLNCVVSPISPKNWILN